MFHVSEMEQSQQYTKELHAWPARMMTGCVIETENINFNNLME